MHHHSNQIFFYYDFHLLFPICFTKSVLKNFKVFLDFPDLEGKHSCCGSLWLRTELGMDPIYFFP